MSKIIFNEIQIKLLESNPNVDHVLERSISYTPDFDKPIQCLKRWRKTFNQFGEDGFLTERGGKTVLVDHSQAAYS